MSDYGTSFSFNITGAGWAEMVLENILQQRTSITLSYAKDVLPEFIEALILLLTKENRFALIEIDGEGNDATLVMSEMSCDIIRIEVFDNAGLQHFDVFDERVPLPAFTGYADTLYFCKEVCENLAKMVRLMSVDKYKEIWCYDFPTEKLAALQELVNTNITKRIS